MAIRKNLRSDNTYIISTDDTDNPKLGAKILADGRESLFLDYYFGYTKVYDNKKDMEVAKKDRKRVYLKEYLVKNPRTPKERQENKDTLERAKRYRSSEQEKINSIVSDYRSILESRKINFLTYYQTYIDNYTKKDKRNVKLALQRFKDFLRDTPEYSMYADYITPSRLDKDMMEAFTEYLQSRSKGEGAHTLYKRFKKVIKYAVEHDVIRKNPCTGVVIKIDEQVLKKDVLSTEEIQRLIATNDVNQNQEVRRAFIFCLYCGLRWCDVKDLTFANIDYSNRWLEFEQNKTKGHSANSGVVIPLNEGLLKLVGEPKKGQSKNTLLFDLPSHTMCLKSLKRWVKRAGIDKHITWHCARHSFAVNILNNGANIKTVASLLGHSGLKHTEKYTRAIDRLKQEAINSLPQFKIDNE